MLCIMTISSVHGCIGTRLDSEGAMLTEEGRRKCPKVVGSGLSNTNKQPVETNFWVLSWLFADSEITVKVHWTTIC